jgi:hypothetical protein
VCEAVRGRAPAGRLIADLQKYGATRVASASLTRAERWDRNMYAFGFSFVISERAATRYGTDV